MAVSPLIAPERFLNLDGICHLSTGGEAPVLTTHGEAVARFFRDKAGGMPGRLRMAETVDRARERIGRLLGLPGEDVAFLAHASEGLALAARQLDLRPGDNVVMARSEFPSLLLAFQALAERGAELRLVGGVVPTIADYAKAVDQRTRAIAVSHVSYLSGARADLGALRAVVDSAGARLIVDVSHALGAVPVDGRLCDVAVGCTYKWLMAVHGCGLFVLNRGRWPDLQPAALGWHAIEEESDWPSRDHYRVKQSMERFEIGNVAYLPLYLLDNALGELLALGTDRILHHVEALASDLRAGLVAQGRDVLTPEAPAARAGNLSFSHPDSAAVEAALRKLNILVWAGDGRVRISVHVHNGSSDVAQCLERLAALA
jgi:cysteine desulfurase/selenocysteine lyase